MDLGGKGKLGCEDCVSVQTEAWGRIESKEHSLTGD